MDSASIMSYKGERGDISYQEPVRLPLLEFLETFKNAPRASVNFVITDCEGRVLLTRRNIAPQEGSWHYPGCFILKNESIANCQMRLAKDELGLDISAEITPSLLGVFDDLVGDPRGHVIDIVYGFTIDDTSQIKTTDQTSEIGFFDKLPQDMGFSHRQSLIGLGFKTD